MQNLFQELKRRNVFRVGTAYVIVAWVIAQVVDLAADNFGAPDWFTKMVLIVLVLGLPIALLLSWAYEVTLEGVKKTEEVDKKKSITHGTGQRINKLIVGALVLALGFIVYQNFVSSPERIVREAEAGQTSIAVLPFADLSQEGDQEYFSDGISEEILNVLAKIPELRVAARTSSFQFKGQNQDITNIGQQLGVSYVLEGSIRKQGDQVRITAQLIDASNGFHLWSENYDRSLDNIFVVQDEISHAIVDELKSAMGLVVTSNFPQIVETTPEAYDLYLLGVHEMEKRGAEQLAQGADYFEAALEIDPDYVPAIARLAMTYLLLPGYDFVQYPPGVWEPKGEALARRAIEMNPDLPESQAAMGFFFNTFDQHDLALPYLKRAIELNPSYTTAKVWYGNSLEGTGRYEEALAIMEQAVRDDPLSPLALNNLVGDYLARHDFEKAVPLIERLKSLSPGFHHGMKGNSFVGQGNYAEAALEFLKALSFERASNARQGALSNLFFGHFGLLDEDKRLGWFPMDSLIKTGQGEEATKILRGVLTIVPEDDIIVREFGATVFLVMGDFEEAEVLALEALNIFEKKGIPYSTFTGRGFLGLSYVLNKNGDPRLEPITDAYLRDIDRQMAAGIKDPTHHWVRGMTHLRRGDEAAAKAEIETAFANGLYLDSLDFWLLQQYPAFDLSSQMAAYEARQAENRAAFLKIVCNGGNPTPEVWTPLDETCEGHVEAAQ